MGRATQFIDYLNRPPEKLNKDFIDGHYTHFTIDDNTKSVRRKHLRQLREEENK